MALALSGCEECKQLESANYCIDIGRRISLVYHAHLYRQVSAVILGALAPSK